MWLLPRVCDWHGRCHMAAQRDAKNTNQKDKFQAACTKARKGETSDLVQWLLALSESCPPGKQGHTRTPFEYADHAKTESKGKELAMDATRDLMFWDDYCIHYTQTLTGKRRLTKAQAMDQWTHDRDLIFLGDNCNQDNFSPNIVYDVGVITVLLRGLGWFGAPSTAASHHMKCSSNTEAERS